MAQIRSEERNTAFPDPTVGLLATAAFSAFLYSSGNPIWISLLLPALVAIPVLIYVFARNIFVSLTVLIASSAIPRYFIDVSGTKARPEHLAAALLCVACVLIYRRENTLLVWIFSDFMLAGLVAMNFFSSGFESIAPAQTMKWSAQQLLAILPYFLLRVLAATPERFRKAVQIMLGVGTIEAGYAVICFFSNRLFATTFGVDVGQYGDIPGIYGTQFEANLLGSYCAACLMMMLLMYFRERRQILLWGSMVLYSGVLVSLSRAAMAAAFVALLVLVILALKYRLVSLSFLRRPVLLLGAATLFLAISIAPLYYQRFSTLSISEPTADDTTKIRVLGLAAAAERTLQHPFLGTGTNSFQLDFDYSEIGYMGVDTAGWIGNPEMRIWHDTGIIGLGFFILFVTTLAIQGWRAARAGPPELLGLLLGGLVYAMSFQATDATILGFPWIHFGMIATGIAIARHSGNTRRSVSLKAEA